MHYYLFLVFKSLFQCLNRFPAAAASGPVYRVQNIISSLLWWLTYLCTFITFDPMLCKSNNYVIYPLKLCFFEVFSLLLISLVGLGPSRNTMLNTGIHISAEAYEWHAKKGMFSNLYSFTCRYLWCNFSKIMKKV